MLCLMVGHPEEKKTTYSVQAPPGPRNTGVISRAGQKITVPRLVAALGILWNYSVIQRLNEKPKDS